MSLLRHPRVHSVARFIGELRRCGFSQQTVMFAVDRGYPTITYKEFLVAVLIHEVGRDADLGGTRH
jgi:hypothetical protein